MLSTLNPHDEEKDEEWGQFLPSSSPVNKMLASWGYKNGPLTSKNRRGPLNPIQTDLKYKKFTVFNEYTQARMKEHEHGYRQTCVFCSCLRT